MSRWQFIEGNQRDEWLENIKKKFGLIHDLPSELKTDKAFMREVVKIKPRALQYIPTELKNDEEFVRMIVSDLSEKHSPLEVIEMLLYYNFDVEVLNKIYQLYLETRSEDKDIEFVADEIDEERE